MSVDIAVLVKRVPDINDVTIDPATRRARIGPGRVINTFDHYALAAALGLRDQVGGSVTAITAGPPEAREILVRCLASGADEAILIDLPDHNDVDTLALARVIASELAKHAFNLVVAGQSSDDYEGGQVGPQVAEVLQWPHVTLVTHADVDGDRLRVRRDAEATKEDLSVPLPAVLIVLSGRDSDQRYPTLRGMMTAKKQSIVIVTPELGSRSRLAWSEPIAGERDSTGIIVQGEPAAEMARQLVSWLEERKLV